jgi:hypothetical protein
MDNAQTPHASQELLLWRALSEVFLDTEKSEADFRVIANALIATGADRATMRRTLIDDVAPHLMGNLQTTAGEWMGWDDDVLLYGMELAAIRRMQPRWPWDKDRRMAVQFARKAWDKIAVYLRF